MLGDAKEMLTLSGPLFPWPLYLLEELMRPGRGRDAQATVSQEYALGLRAGSVGSGGLGNPQSG